MKLLIINITVLYSHLSQSDTVPLCFRLISIKNPCQSKCFKTNSDSRTSIIPTHAEIHFFNEHHPRNSELSLSPLRIKKSLTMDATIPTQGCPHPTPDTGSKPLYNIARFRTRCAPAALFPARPVHLGRPEKRRPRADCVTVAIARRCFRLGDRITVAANTYYRLSFNSKIQRVLPVGLRAVIYRLARVGQQTGP